MITSKEAKAISSMPLAKKQEGYDNYYKKYRAEEAALAELKKKNEKLILYVENDTLGAKFGCPLSILMLLAVFGYASLFLLPAAAYNMGIELPTFVEALISEYVLGMSFLVAIILIIIGVPKMIWSTITGKTLRYHKALKDIDSLTKQLATSKEYYDFYEKEVKHARFPTSTPIKPNAHINMTFYNLSAGGSEYDDFDTSQADEDEELARIFEEEREREEQERKAYEEEQERQRQIRDEEETEEYLDMLEEQAIFFSDDEDYGY